MCFSTLCVIVMTPILYSIIWFERDNHNRTLINQLFTSVVWCAIIWNAIIQPWTLLRYLVGPVNSPVFCNLDFLLRNVISMKVGLLQNSIIIARCICLYWAKNPTALQDDFWQIFVDLWTLGVALISQLVYVLLPGKSPMKYYICIGQYPMELDGITIKENYPQFATSALTTLIYIFAKAAERKEHTVNEKNTHTLFTFTLHGVGLFLLVIFILVPYKINSFRAKELEIFSNYVLVYILHHFILSVVIVLLTLTLFYKKISLRKKIWAEVMISVKK
jgi:hypothetical protein